MPGGGKRTFVLFLYCILTGSRRVWYCCLHLEEPRNRRVQLRFGHSGLKVTGLSFLACVPSDPDVFTVSGSRCSELGTLPLPKWRTILLPLQAPQLPRSLKSQLSSSGMGAESLPPGDLAVAAPPPF